VAATISRQSDALIFDAKAVIIVVHRFSMQTLLAKADRMEGEQDERTYS
jgi:hypothetical protein